MGWAEHRVEEYQKGEGANWLEKRMLEHANPVYFALAGAAAVCLGYGLWMHNWPAISVAALLALFGHTYCRTRYPESTGSGARDAPEGDYYLVRVRHTDAPSRRRAGSLVRALSGYGSFGRARREARGKDHGGHEKNHGGREIA
jgi:hypothetical protein